MGFYGNITNTSRTTFQFDRVYPSRYEMDLNTLSDGIYAGRYVLVEYDTDLDATAYNKPWYRVTAKNGKPKLYTSINYHNPDSGYPYLYFENVNGDTVIKADDTALATPTIYLEAGHSFTLLNSDIFFIKLNKNGRYEIVTFTEFSQKIAYIGNLDDLSNMSDEEIMGTLPHAHIANEIAALDTMDGFDETTIYKYAVVLPGRYYTYNTEGEFWNILDTTFSEGDNTFPNLSKVISRNNYQINFDNDKTNYRTSRGYDSTVWQKVYSNGTEKYVMVAELNTVVPTFGITADAPTLLPINPHWGSDSTNVYYNLHWQPQWGFRTKAASNVLTGPAIDSSGQLYLDADNNLSSQGSFGITLLRDPEEDKIYYPSDERTTWRQTFENLLSENDENRKTLYYNEETRKWQTDSSETIPAAIYYNKAGFNATKIAYSSDLIDPETVSLGYNRYDQNVARSNWVNRDQIRITPTGLSGNTYNKHDGTIDQQSQVDTQEISIMLPSIGNTISKVWDIVYGGRDTNEVIKQKNRRNLDIEWEDANGGLGLRGLRLRGTYGTQYDKKAVNTLAGCINTAHDLFGMIIAPRTEAQLSNIAELDNNIIYYNTDRQSYVRKHLTYDYTAIEGQDSSVYNYEAVDPTEEMNQEKINTGLYYRLVNGQYVVATTYVPGETYYYKTVKTIYIPVSNLVDFPYQGFRWYKADNAQSADDDTMADYVWNPEYQSGRNYYKITVTPLQLGDNYESDTYFYQTAAGFLLDRETHPTAHTGGYWKIKHDSLINIKGQNFKGVYIPYVYYYQDTNGNFVLDTSPYADMNGARDDKYYTIKKTKEFKNEDGDEGLYVENTYYTPITLNASTFISGAYYVEDPDQPGTYTLYIGSFDSNLSYFAKNSTYRKVTDTTQVQIDTSTFVRKGELCIYQDNTYFIRNYDLQDDTIISYLALDRAYIQDHAEELASKNIYTFGEWSEYGEQNHSPNYLPIGEAVIRASNDPSNVHNRLEAVNNFYEADKYHYERDGSYILDTSPLKNDDFNYYLINTVTGPQTGVTYYEKGKYYQDSGQEDQWQVIETDLKPTSGTIYKKDALYIYSDTTVDQSSKLERGMEWNVDAKSVPSNITLARRTDRWELKPLDTYARDVSTLNGMILKMVQKLELGDNLTRDNSSVSGVINQVKDKIARFGRMRSQQITIIDDNGRLQSAAISYRQNNSLTTKATNQFIDYTKADIYPTVSSLSNQFKQWITVSVDGDPSNPNVTIHHNFQGVDNTQHWLNKNGNLDGESNASTIATDKIPLYTPIVDEMGHVVGNDTLTITLPYGFKTIKNNGVGAETTNMSTSTTDIVAENTQDILTINSHDKWIRLASNAENDTLTIAHEIHSITTTALTKNFNDTNSGDTFTATDIGNDIAGHITSNQAHTYTLPYSWKQINHNGVGSATTDMSTNTTAIIPENCKDTLTINSGNAWITLAGDNTSNNKVLTIAHKVNSITETAKSDTNLDGVGSFTVQDILKDNAGHITAIQSHKYNLPFNWRNITVKAASTESTGTTGASAESTLEADTYNDTLTFIPGNKWITLQTSPSNDSVTFGHAAAGTASTTVISADQTPAFNATFDIPTIGIDQLGHVSALSTKTVKIPNITLTNGTGNVVTGISYNNGAFTESKANIGTLVITGYGIASAASSLAETDTLNSALGKLEKQISEEITNRGNAISGLNGGTIGTPGSNKTITSLSQSAGNISAEFGDIAITADQVTVNDDANFDTRYHTRNQIAENYTYKGTTYLYEEGVEESAPDAGDGRDPIYVTNAQLVARVKILEDTIKSLINLIPNTVIPETDKTNLLANLDWTEGSYETKEVQGEVTPVVEEEVTEPTTP